MFELEFKGAEALQADLRNYPGGVTRAMVRALNRAIAAGRTQITRDIAADTGLRVSNVRKALSMQEATDSRPEARLATSLKRIPLINFGARGQYPSRGRGRGVSYRLNGSSGRVPTAFIASMQSGHQGVFVRKAKGRLPIRELFGPSLGHVFAKHRPAALARAQQVFHERLEHELARLKVKASGE
jgi:hypothetical protein